jgi:hypothetical protein
VLKQPDKHKLTNIRRLFVVLLEAARFVEASRVSALSRNPRCVARSASPNDCNIPFKRSPDTFTGGFDSEPEVTGGTFVKLTTTASNGQKTSGRARKIAEYFGDQVISDIFRLFPCTEEAGPCRANRTF